MPTYPHPPVFEELPEELRALNGLNTHDAPQDEQGPHDQLDVDNDHLVVPSDAPSAVDACLLDIASRTYFDLVCNIFRLSDNVLYACAHDLMVAKTCKVVTIISRSALSSAIKRLLTWKIFYDLLSVKGVIFGLGKGPDQYCYVGPIGQEVYVLFTVIATFISPLAVLNVHRPNFINSFKWPGTLTNK
jgi:hypothetical protein